MVLVDPAFPGSDDPYLDGLEKTKAAEAMNGQRNSVRCAKRCLEMARRHEIVALRAARPACLDDPPNPELVLHQVLDRQDASVTFCQA